MWVRQHQELSEKLIQICDLSSYKKIYQNKLNKFAVDFKDLNIETPKIEDIHKALYLVVEGNCLLMGCEGSFKNDIFLLKNALGFLENFVDYFQKMNEKI